MNQTQLMGYFAGYMQKQAGESAVAQPGFDPISEKIVDRNKMTAGQAAVRQAMSGASFGDRIINSAANSLPGTERLVGGKMPSSLQLDEIGKPINSEVVQATNTYRKLAPKTYQSVPVKIAAPPDVSETLQMAGNLAKPTIEYLAGVTQAAGRQLPQYMKSIITNGTKGQLNRLLR